MRPRMIRNLSRTRTLRLCLEFLEDRRLLSGMAHPGDGHLSRPSDDDAAVYGPVQHTGSDEHARTFVHSPHGHMATGSDATERGDDARPQGPTPAAKEDQTNGPRRAARESNDGRQKAAGANSTDRNDQSDRPEEMKHADDNTPPAQHHSSAAPASDAEPGSSRHERASDGDDADRASGASAASGRSRADRSLDDSDRSTETGRSADEATTARVPAAHAVDTAGAARTGLGAAQRNHLAGPPALHAAAAVLEKALVDGPRENLSHQLHADRAERPESPMAEPARDEAPSELAATALTAQANAPSLAHSGAEGDRQAGAFNAPFLVLGEGRGESGFWGLSLTAADLGAAGDSEARGETIRFGAGARLAQQAGYVVESTLLPEGSELAAGVLSADTSALEEAVRQFLGGLHTVGRELTRVLADNGWARWAVVATLTALAAETGRRRLQERSRRGASPEEEEGVTLSWLSGSYPFRPEEV